MVYLRLHNGNALQSAKEAAALRLRPILMTAMAMVVGMIPMAVARRGGTPDFSCRTCGGHRADRLHFCGVAHSSARICLAQEKTSTKSPSLEADDEESREYMAANA